MAWLFERHSFAASVLVVLVVLVAYFLWRYVRAENRLTAAALRCDLDAIERCASDPPTRIFGRFALLHHGGFARALTPFCTCGACEKDAMEDEILRIARIVRAAYEGRGDEAYDLACELDLEAKDVPPVITQYVMTMRLVTTHVAYAALAEDDPERERIPAGFVDGIVDEALSPRVAKGLCARTRAATPVL